MTTMDAIQTVANHIRNIEELDKILQAYIANGDLLKMKYQAVAINTELAKLKGVVANAPDLESMNFNCFNKSLKLKSIIIWWDLYLEPIMFFPLRNE